ncbi:hypothetical protein CYLTODRAFT_423950 [Cylindrobasidium torrendii FP15055 ss-10]|uniref:Uncharacterized protein n=1 Tax=Cylindrobasidium torrendii FP15055 ss-10 TaxID=1314674 RepID=A0A0D7B5U7_9AGAR|nr:hypothetical protein CYLTODRAFT_423950 [Cylindrobasidium torrendii FP15055 ss-10]
MPLTDGATSDTNMDDDLFGDSPPTSPELTRGRSMRLRSASPMLALPGATNCVDFASQNVGTIALPGSQHDIELGFHPLASSLSGPLRPPAQSQSQSRASSPADSIDSDDESPRGSRSKSSKKDKNPRKRKASTPYERPAPPEIPMPDPTGPIPAHFFRSQSALLGHAGLVAGLQPSKITHGQFRGTPANPIIVNDDSPQADRTLRPTIKLPTHNNEEIVRVLLQEKSVLSMLHELLTLMARGRLAQYYTRASKRQRTDYVPAGAGGWDINQTPDVQIQRCKFLVAEIMTHIRTATRNLTMKKLWKEQPPRAQTSAPTVVPMSSQMAPAPQSPTTRPPAEDPPASSTPPIATPLSFPLQDNNKENQWFDPPAMSFDKLDDPFTTPDNTLDQLLSTLLNASSATPDMGSHAPGGQPEVEQSPNTEMEQWFSMIDAWMPIVGGEQTTSPMGEPVVPTETGFDLGLMGSGNMAGEAMGSQWATLPEGAFSTPEVANVAGCADSNLPGMPFWSGNEDMAIDPSLLGGTGNSTPLPVGQFFGTHTGSLDAVTAPGETPIQSPPNMGPSTSAWEMAEPDVAQQASTVDTQPMDIDEADLAALALAKEAENHADVHSVLPALISALFPKGTDKVKVTRPVLTGIGTRMGGAKEILQEAQRRRNELAAAIVEARTKLWETTIEQGVLAHLSGYYKSK